jgi:hypothetical protein
MRVVRFPYTLLQATSHLTIIFCSLSFIPNQRAAQAQSNAAPQGDERAKLIKILTNPILWRKDFPSLLAAQQGWHETGETKVFVFSNEAYGRRKFELSATVSLPQTAELQSWIINKPKLKADVESALASTWNEPLTKLTAVGQPGREDNSMRVAVSSKTLAPPELLAPGLTMATVIEQSGDPESVTTEILDTGGSERRPVILTIYHFAGDAVSFAVSDMSPTPGVVERAILDTAKVSGAIFTSAGSKNKTKNNK